MKFRYKGPRAKTRQIWRYVVHTVLKSIQQPPDERPVRHSHVLFVNKSAGGTAIEEHRRA